MRVEDATPLCLLVNEFITNSVKHGFVGRDEGQIEVAMRRNGVDKLEVHVADDGVGFDEEDGGDGHGRQIVEALTQQLRGELITKNGDGTSWQLIFPPEPTGDGAAKAD